MIFKTLSQMLGVEGVTRVHQHQASGAEDPQEIITKEEMRPTDI